MASFYAENVNLAFSLARRKKGCFKPLIKAKTTNKYSKNMLQKIKENWKEYLIVLAIGAAATYFYCQYQNKQN